MKIYSRKIIIYLFSILIVAAVVEGILRKVPNPYQYKYEWMEQHAEDVEVIVLGGSHGFYNIRPEFLEGKAFSMANVSQDITIDWFLLRKWAKRYQNLKTVIIPISYPTWTSQGLKNGLESYRCRYYNIYMACDLYPGILNHFELSDLRTAQGKFRKFIFRSSDTGYDAYGWGTGYKLKNKNILSWNDGSEARAAVERHTARNWDNLDSNKATMLDLAQFCKNHHIRLIIVTTPCWHTYYDNLESEQLSKMYELTHHFQKEFDVPYFDYMKDQRFNADDFYDSDHLSDIGAEKFTKILNKDIKRLEK